MPKNCHWQLLKPFGMLPQSVLLKPRWNLKSVHSVWFVFMSNSLLLGGWSSRIPCSVEYSLHAKVGWIVLVSRAWWTVPWICDAAFLCQAWQLPFWNLIAFTKPGKCREMIQNVSLRTMCYTIHWYAITSSYFRKWTGAETHTREFLRRITSTD